MGRQRQVWLIPIADERVGVQVKLWDPLRTHDIPAHFWRDDSQRCAMSSACTFTFTIYNVSAIHQKVPFGRLAGPMLCEPGNIYWLSEAIVSIPATRKFNDNLDRFRNVSQSQRCNEVVTNLSNFCLLDVLGFGHPKPGWKHNVIDRDAPQVLGLENRIGSCQRPLSYAALL